MKRSKHIFSVILSTSLILCAFVSNSYAAPINYTLIMDNDALSSSGTTNPWLQDGDFGGYNMSYFENTHLYNGDARRGTCSSRDSATGCYGVQYVWKHGIGKVQRLSLYAYLWDDTFTESNAVYEHRDSYLTAYRFGSINQNTAPAGWGYIGSRDFNGGVANTFSMDAAHPNGPTHYAGADAIKVIYTISKV